jgi:hypothetical protein
MSSGFQRYRSDHGSGGGSLSAKSKSKSKIHTLLRELETEFDKMWVDNAQLRERIASLEKLNLNCDEDQSGGARSNQTLDVMGRGGVGAGADEHDMFDKSMLKSFTKNKAIKTGRHKLKAHTSKIVSSFKPPAMSCMLVKEFRVY